ncbi:FGGY family carbohydrate kinase [Nocardioides sp.]|uniref:FGGY family carbohydrate kinase n=1 Tax=Nocardioides sp. TaxID=35761 RepID=UPI002612AEA1|nr:FGGY family carbohydrate kinase [Nocardioides sp.]
MASVSPLTLGIDVGTTGLKVIAFDPADGVVAQTSRSNALSSPYAGWAEASPRQWLDHCLDAVAEIAAQVGPARVAALATSGMVPAVVCADEAGTPLRAAILQADARAGDEVAQIAAELAEHRPLECTGSSVTQQSVAPTARWLAAHEPEIWERTAWVLGSYDWLLVALGASLHVERNWAIESGLFRLDTTGFGPALRAGGLEGRVPPVAASGAVVGGLNAAAARRTGLAVGTPLVVGGADHVLSAAGAGLVREGEWLVKLGGAGDLLAVSAAPVVDERFYLDEHPVSGLWLPNGCMATSGSLVRWVQGLLDIDDLRSMDAQAALRPAAPLLVLPYFLGEKSPLNDPDLRGVIAGLQLGTDKVDLYRAALEGIAFGFRHNAEALQDAGVRLGEATVTNGGATSQLWKEIHASVLGVPLRTVLDHPGASLGAAIAAAIGAGLSGSWAEVPALCRYGAPVLPDPGAVGRYEEAYGLWRDLGVRVAPTMRSLARRP